MKPLAVRAYRALHGVGVGAFRHYRSAPPTFGTALGPLLLVSALLFTRSPHTNYIFDEQEALLANPYVNGDALSFTDVLTRDFWGLPAERSIGSYRPLPNILWRSLWKAHPVLQHPWAHHVVNVVIHAVNAALLAAFALRLTGSHRTAWLSGTCFVSAAIVTEAVTGVVGLADVLGGLGILLALQALALPAGWMGPAVFGALVVGFFSKESTLVAVPLVAWAALVTAPVLHERPRRLLRSALALLAAIAAMALYTEVRRAFFSAPAPAIPVTADGPMVQKGFAAFLRWFSQPKLPADPINNPLVDADTAQRVAGALAVHARGIGQVLFPWTLSGDYSYQEEQVPEQLVSFASVVGGLLLTGPPVAGVVVWLRSSRRERRAAGGAPSAPAGARARLLALALALVWVPVAYFPHSNIPVLLPTVRADRFWYVPIIGSSLGLGILGTWLLETRRARVAAAGIAVFLCFQALRARAHALDYSSDLAFWRATARAAPQSAKAHLNYGVMLGARGRLEERLVENQRALRLAPGWPMAHVYVADALCRLHRPDEAWPHYVEGFRLAPNDRNLIALGLQCLWDADAVATHRRDLLHLATEHRGTWLAHLGRDIVHNGEKHRGVDPQYRPRGYDEGPKHP
jgi:hypothetical protein